MNLSALFRLMIILLIASVNAYGKDNQSYAVSLIPDIMKKDANAVIRMSDTKIAVEASDNIVVSEKYAITILNEKGARYADLQLVKSKFTNPGRISATVYDKEGKWVREAKKKDVVTHGMYTNNLTDDISYVTVDFGEMPYPYTCEYESETIISSLVFIPDWHITPGLDCSVQLSTIALLYPGNVKIRYYKDNLHSEPVLTDDGGYSTLSDTIRNLAAQPKPHKLIIARDNTLPTLMFNAEQFQLMGHEGSLTTWKDFGKFFYELNEGRDKLSDEVKKTVHRLTDTCTSAGSKIKILYAHLQKNTRYVSIQLGIGGWQTLEALFVCEKGYGDCKALTNYMKALLGEAGIVAYQALVYGGAEEKRKMISGFPHMGTFNHVILCVPSKVDSVWLECTSQTFPAGYLSSFTNDRNVLLLTPDGGMQVHTPAVLPKDNTIIRNADFVVGDDNVISGYIALRFTGDFWNNEHYKTEKSKTDVDDYMNRRFKIGNYTVAKYTVVNDRSTAVPFIDETVTIRGKDNIQKTEKAMFLSGNAFSYNVDDPDVFSTDDNPFELNESYTIIDTLIYKLGGDHYMQDYNGGNMDLPFASYHYKATLETGNVVKIIANYTQRRGTYSSSEYSDYLKMYRQMRTDYSTKLVLGRKD